MGAREGMERIVLTGATGLLGERVLRLVQTRYEVHAIVRRRPVEPLAGVEYHEADLAGDWSTLPLPPRASAVVHLAQPENMRDFPARALEIYGVNLAAVAVLLDYARRSGASRFVLGSTGGLYGACAAPIDESQPLAPPGGPLGYYFDTKRAAELLAGAYREALRVVILRPFFIYGPGQRGTMLVPRLVESVRSGRPVRLRGAGGTRMNPVHVDDAAAVVDACLGLGSSETINVAGPQIVTIRDMVERIGELLGIAPKFEAEPGEAEGLVADITKMRAIVPRTLIDYTDGVKGVVEEWRRRS